MAEIWNSYWPLIVMLGIGAAATIFTAYLVVLALIEIKKLLRG